ncbi:MAG: cobalt transporter CbiM [Deltaproteobacteria bacterium]|nr:MAG: cobalt transporter CbiM [Deltaproteobacteria bacterium]
MHISEGVLSGQVLAAGAALSAAGVAVGLKRTSNEQIPEVAILASAFFVASLIHVPLGPTSVHLILNGLVGLILGWATFPAILVGLFLQALLFQFGGLTTLGVNTFNMAFPGIVCWWIFGPMVRGRRPRLALVGAFFCGVLAVLGAGLLVALSLYLTGKGFEKAAAAVLLAHLPVMALEGILTAFTVAFLRKVKPDMLGVKR